MPGFVPWLWGSATTVDAKIQRDSMQYNVLEGSATVVVKLRVPRPEPTKEILTTMRYEVVESGFTPFRP